LAVLLPSFHGPHHDQVRERTQKEEARALAGKWLATNFAPQDLLAVKPAGIIPYYSGLTAVDFYCLLDRRSAASGRRVQSNRVGHQRVNVPYVLSLRPKVVLLDEQLYPSDRLPDPQAGDGPVETDWRADARSRDYFPVRAEVTPGRWLQYFLRREQP
jgi:hypothetical protein